MDPTPIAQTPHPDTYELSPGFVVAQTADGIEYVAHRLVVRRHPDIDAEALDQRLSTIGAKLVDVDGLMAVKLGVLQIELPQSLLAADVVAPLESGGWVSKAELDYVVRTDAVPNDALYAQLWGMRAIDMEAAWEHTTGSPQIVVAVLDTGVDTTHPDLRANVFANPNEVAGNGVDDDGNGFIDDVAGWDFVSQDASPHDTHGHGTHVAGTIGAVGNDAVGVVGVNWQVALLPVQVLSASGSGSLVGVAQGILYAGEMGASVVNASLGRSGPPVSYVSSAIESLRDDGGLFVAAAGNDGTNNDSAPHWPSNYEVANVVSVAATDANDALAYFSNYGASSVDLGAPGVSILSTYPNGRYVQLNGTSMAAPHVAGAAAWLFAYDPNATYSSVRERLLSTTDAVSALQGRVATGGRLNVRRLASDTNECLDGSATCPPHARCEDRIDGYECVCEGGYEADGQRCVDVDECATEQDNCHQNALCHNIEGSFECTCTPGFTGDGVTCADVDECATMPCAEDAQCTNEPGGYACRCHDGFSGDGATCVDIDECATDQDNCHDNAACANTHGSFACTCLSGWTGNGVQCNDVDECAASTDGCDVHADCANTAGSYACTCQLGFVGDGFACDDVDECALGLHQCHANADCTNNVGGFTCDCAVGYSGDGTLCTDLDECDEGLDACDEHATCSNLDGSYACFCEDGWAGDGQFCNDVDECAASPCDANAACTNLPGSVSCACATGYSGDGFSCVDADECALGTDDCSADADCTNTVGGFGCACHSGFTGDGRDCVDVDECASGSDNCSPDATCTNTAGGFDCTCNLGFSGNGASCSDDDECALGIHTCDPLASCTNTPGAYDCTCAPGYTGDGFSCSDPNECTDGTHDCHADATCTNTAGGFACTCRAGFSGDGKSCADIDECAAGSHGCDPDAACTNTHGNYLCTCPSGYDGPGTSCADIDECARGLADCHPHAACTNTAGGFSCECAAGYVGDGRSCSDVDECATGNHDCAPSALCTNEPGGFSCACPPGEVGDGRSCTPDECALGTDNCSPHATCTDTVAGYSCTCGAGYAGDGTTCTDVDECAQGPCHAKATCLNTDGGFSCTCAGGFHGDGLSCSDDDECALGTHACDADAHCINLEQSYDCACNSGFVGNGFSCVDVDECASGSDDCHADATCTNDVGGHSCTCNPGLLGDGISCVAPGDDDECALGTDNCHADATCINETGGFSCECNAGFVGDGVLCADVDECQANPCHANATCSNQPGSYVCTCDGGFAGDGFSCSDVDECAGGGCHPDATCSNSWGGFSCQCPAGFSGDGTSCTDIDECANGTDSCGVNALCINESGGHRCDCPTGYDKQGGACIDIDECANGSDLCHVDATCTNTAGSYACACNAGLDGDGFVCDVDECATGAHDCDANAACSNNVGSYTCSCSDGFSGDGESCADIDECADGSHACDANATCNNTFGAYDCTCDADFDGDGRFCQGEPRFVSQIAAGGDHTCVVLDNGAVRCWGRNTYGQLGAAHTDNLGDDETSDALAHVIIGGAVERVAAGVAHSCALLAGGTVRCWGRNRFGQLGYAHTLPIGDNEHPATAGDVDVGGSVVDIVAGGEHTCALLDDGAVQCWGLGIDGQLGYGDRDTIGDNETPAQAGTVPLGEPAIAVSAGRDHTCAVLASGAVRCWGRNQFGQLGRGDTTTIGDDELPTADVALGGAAIDVTAGWYHTCALLLDGSVRCWGYGYVGQLGLASQASVGDDELPSTAAVVDVGANVTSIAAGVYHTCAVLFGGDVRCWGYGNGGQLGYAASDNVGDDEHPATLPPIELGDAATTVVTGYAHSCALLASGAARCWGSADFGQLGTGSTIAIGDDEHPTGAAAVMLSAVDECALGSDNCHAHAACTNEPDGFACACEGGYVGDGQACSDIDECADGLDDCDLNASCTNRDGGFDCVCDDGFEGDGATCANTDECALDIDDCDVNATCRDEDGTFRCECDLGYDGDGVTCTPLGSYVVAVAAGERHSCALMNGGTVRCWGYGFLGRLGYGDGLSVGGTSLPWEAGDVPVGGIAVQIVAGHAHTCARLDTGAVRCWGNGSSGALGYGDTAVIGDTEVVAAVGDVDVGGAAVHLAAGGNHTCAVLDTGAVRCWGFGAAGQLGYANTATIGDNEMPSSVGDVDVGGFAVAVTAGSAHTCALLDDGTIRCWGGNNSGQLGYGHTTQLGDDEHPSSAGALSIGGPAVNIDAGDHHTCAVRDDGDLVCWGSGLYGMLGHGNTDNVGDDESPSAAGPVPIGEAVAQVAAGGTHTCAVLTGGGTLCWGRASTGQIGYGDTQNVGDDELPSETPLVLLGGTATQLALGTHHSCAVLSAGVVCWGYGENGQLGYGNTATIGDDELPIVAGFVPLFAP